MSAIEHRQRIRDQRAKAREFQSGSFTPQEEVGRIEPPEPATEPAVPTRVEQPIDNEPKAVVPQGERQAMTPQQLRDHAAQLAKSLAQLPEDLYNESLNNLEQTNATLYAIVCDELNNLAAAQKQAEGDGYDLNEMQSTE